MWCDVTTKFMKAFADTPFFLCQRQGRKCLLSGDPRVSLALLYHHHSFEEYFYFYLPSNNIITCHRQNHNTLLFIQCDVYDEKGRKSERKLFMECATTSCILWRGKGNGIIIWSWHFSVYSFCVTVLTKQCEEEYDFICGLFLRLPFLNW